MSSFLGNEFEEILVKRLSEHAVLPTRGSSDAAGFDLSSCIDTIVPARGKSLVPTDLSIAIPQNTYARVAPRSGLAWKHFIDVGAGVVDYDYRGNVGVVLFNHSEQDFEVKKGDRIAQLILERICMAPLREVDELPSTERGAGGFGSTGMTGSIESKGSGESSSSKVRVVAPDGQQSVKELLLFLNGLGDQDNAPWIETFGSYDEAKKRLKPLALDNNIGLVAAMQAYEINGDFEDLVETLFIIANR